MKQRIAISACLLGHQCRYDGDHRRNETLLKMLEGSVLVPFCPEDACFGTPREPMDLERVGDTIKAIRCSDKADLTPPLESYAKEFFDTHQIDLFIGKDRSPSCGACSAIVYDKERNVIRKDAPGIMARAAQKRGIETMDAEAFIKKEGK